MTSIVESVRRCKYGAMAGTITAMPMAYVLLDPCMARAGAKTRYERTRYYRLGGWFERAGWAAIAAGVTAAALGAFGGGWLSETEIASGNGGVTARYERFWRSGTPFDLEVVWRAEPGETTLWMDAAYLTHFVVETVTPEPARVALGGDRIFYTFLVAEGTSGQAGFRLAARESGSFGGELGLVGGESLPIRQRIFP